MHESILDAFAFKHLRNYQIKLLKAYTEAYYEGTLQPKNRLLYMKLQGVKTRNYMTLCFRNNTNSDFSRYSFACIIKFNFHCFVPSERYVSFSFLRSEQTNFFTFLRFYHNFSSMCYWLLEPRIFVGEINLISSPLKDVRIYESSPKVVSVMNMRKESPTNLH